MRRWEKEIGRRTAPGLRFMGRFAWGARQASEAGRRGTLCGWSPAWRRKVGERSDGWGPPISKRDGERRSVALAWLGRLACCWAAEWGRETGHAREWWGPAPKTKRGRKWEWAGWFNRLQPEKEREGEKISFSFISKPIFKYKPNQMLIEFQIHFSTYLKIRNFGKSSKINFTTFLNSFIL